MTKNVQMETSAGTCASNSTTTKAPLTVANFLAYVNKGHYDGTVFHRVIKGFMVQGGGFEPGMKQKPTDAPIAQRGQQRPEEQEATRWRWRAPATRIRRSRSSSSTPPTTASSTSRPRTPRAGAMRCSAGGRRHRGRRRDREGRDRPQGRARRRAGRRRAHRARDRRDRTMARRGARRRRALPTFFEFARRADWRAIDFISDLHLATPMPRTFEALAAHLRSTPADAVFMLGDLFEAWVGDDMRARARFERACIDVLADAASHRPHRLHGRQPRLPASARRCCATAA